MFVDEALGVAQNSGGGEGVDAAVPQRVGQFVEVEDFVAPTVRGYDDVDVEVVDQQLPRGGFLHLNQVDVPTAFERAGPWPFGLWRNGCICEFA